MPHTPPRSIPALDPPRPEPAPGTAGLGPLVDLKVPLTVWPIPVTGPACTPTGEWAVPPLLAQRLLAVYTHPGDTILAAGGSARLVAATADRLNRRPPHCGPGRRPAPGSVDLIAATPDRSGPPDAGACRRWAHLLTPAGVLAVVLTPGLLPDQPAGVVAAAVGAGLSYLQHLVAVLWPLHADHLDPPDPGPAQPDSAAGDPPGVLPAAHADVLIFAARAEQPTPNIDPDPAARPAGPRPAGTRRGGIR